MQTGKHVLFVVMLCMLCSILVQSGASASKEDKSIEKVGEGIKEMGREIGRTGKQVGREVTDAATHVWYKGLKVSKPLLKDVQRHTRRFWSEVIGEKERTLRELKRENRRLRKRLDKRGGSA